VKEKRIYEDNGQAEIEDQSDRDDEDEDDEEEFDVRRPRNRFNKKKPKLNKIFKTTNK
jgi:hypothetical protein